jgi:hypothetical protein
VTHVAVADCERCRPGAVAQPVNTVSSLAFVVAGVPLVRGRRRVTRALGWAAVATGLGSVAYHGPGTTLGRYVHDASLIALLGLMAVDDVERTGGRTAPPVAVAAVPVVATVGALPALTEVVQPVAGAVAVVAGLARAARADGGRGLAPIGGLAVLGAGALLHALGRTGEPLCDPDTWVQPHAVWHVAAATAVLLRHHP